ncbi:MAG: hypothetical protein ACFFAU_01565 [Candidatus Hodarchaeota archaeon]
MSIYLIILIVTIMILGAVEFFTKVRTNENEEYLELIDNNICPYCKEILTIKQLDKICYKCKIYFRFSDDMGPGGYSERKL